jgi:hypothetical protein
MAKGGLDFPNHIWRTRDNPRRRTPPVVGHAPGQTMTRFNVGDPARVVDLATEVFFHVRANLLVCGLST